MNPVDRNIIIWQNANRTLFDSLMAAPKTSRTNAPSKKEGLDRRFEKLHLNMDN